MTSDSDRRFDENLQAIGGANEAPTGPADSVRRSASMSLHHRQSSQRFLRRPALLSGMGLAAMLALAAVVLFPANGGPTVRAAVVLEKLSKQVTGTDVLDVSLESVHVDEVTADGHVQLSDRAIAGDINVEVKEGDNPIVVDASFALSKEGGWVLIRRLTIPDPQAQAVLSMFLPDGAETLILLPDSVMDEAMDEMSDEGFSDGMKEIRQLASGEIAALVKEIANSNVDVGATTKKLADGTILMTLSIDNVETLRNLATKIAEVMGEDAKAEIDIDDDDVDELIGATIQVVYDPATEAVRSFSVSDVAEMQGTVTVSLLAGDMDAALLDADQVKKPGTRVIDLGALMKAFEGFDFGHD